MAQSKSSDAFISGSYSIPTFVTKSEQFDPMYHAAIVRKRSGRKPKYFVIDEETSEEYEVDASEAWARLINPFLAGAMSHDIIPAISKVLKRDGWSKLLYDISCMQMEATDLLLEYKNEFEYKSGTALQALKILPKTHDDWAIALLTAWHKSRYIYQYDLLKYDENWLYPYSKRKGTGKFECRYNPKELLNYIQISFQDCLDSDDDEEQAEKRTNLKNAINDYLVITPLRQNDREEINDLKESLSEMEPLDWESLAEIKPLMIEELMRQNDQEEINDLKERLAAMKTLGKNLIHDILAEIMDELKNKSSDKNFNQYIAEVEEYAKQLL